MDHHIGTRLKALRKAKGLTTQELANKVNVSQSYISRFENGHAIPNIEMLDRILTELDSSLTCFFSEGFENASEDLIQLMELVKKLNPEARMKLYEFLRVMQDT